MSKPQTRSREKPVAARISTRNPLERKDWNRVMLTGPSASSSPSPEPVFADSAAMSTAKATNC